MVTPQRQEYNNININYNTRTALLNFSEIENQNRFNVFRGISIREYLSIIGAIHSTRIHRHLNRFKRLPMA